MSRASFLVVLVVCFVGVLEGGVIEDIAGQIGGTVNHLRDSVRNSVAGIGAAVLQPIGLGGNRNRYNPEQGGYNGGLGPQNGGVGVNNGGPGVNSGGMEGSYGGPGGYNGGVGGYYNGGGPGGYYGGPGGYYGGPGGHNGGPGGYNHHQGGYGGYGNWGGGGYGPPQGGHWGGHGGHHGYGRPDQSGYHHGHGGHGRPGHHRPGSNEGGLYPNLDGLGLNDNIGGGIPPHRPGVKPTGKPGTSPFPNNPWLDPLPGKPDEFDQSPSGNFPDKPPISPDNPFIPGKPTVKPIPSKPVVTPGNPSSPVKKPVPPVTTPKPVEDPDNGDDEDIPLNIDIRFGEGENNATTTVDKEGEEK